MKKIKSFFKNNNKIQQIFNKDISAAIDRIFPENIWLRPDRNNLQFMKAIVKSSILDGGDYIEFMLHTSELMPGGSNRFRTKDSIEKLYNDLDILFDSISDHFKGVTLSEYYNIKNN